MMVTDLPVGLNEPASRDFTFAIDDSLPTAAVTSIPVLRIEIW